MKNPCKTCIYYHTETTLASRKSAEQAAADAEYCPYYGAPTLYHLDKQIKTDGDW